LSEYNGRDTLSVAEGVSKLILEIRDALCAIKPDVLIEFRQQYVNPALRQLGNMFRAFDCPNDSLMNRVRTVDVKLICGESAPHSDMVTWHPDESVETAALQMTSLLFSVPQLSVRLKERSIEEIEMIRFYTTYWMENRDVLLDGSFVAYKPLANYPILSSSNDKKCIYGLYDDVPLTITYDRSVVHIINGKMTEEVLVRCDEGSEEYTMKVFDCRGRVIASSKLTINSNYQVIHCPPNGLVELNN